MKSSKIINKLLDNYLYNVCATIHTKKSGITAVELCPFVSSTEDIVFATSGSTQRIIKRLYLHNYVLYVLILVG
jgi:hypothetical protein